MKKSLNKTGYFFRWNFLPGFIIIGGIYLISNASKEIVYIIAIIGIISLALWANHNHPKSYVHYFKNEQKKIDEKEKLDKQIKKYFK